MLPSDKGFHCCLHQIWTNYNTEFRGRCRLAMDYDKSGLCFSAGREMKTQLFICKLVKAQIFTACRGVKSCNFRWLFWHASPILCSPLDVYLQYWSKALHGVRKSDQLPWWPEHKGKSGTGTYRELQRQRRAGYESLGQKEGKVDGNEQWTTRPGIIFTRCQRFLEPEGWLVLQRREMKPRCRRRSRDEHREYTLGRSLQPGLPEGTEDSQGSLKSRLLLEMCLPAAPLPVHTAMRQRQAPKWAPAAWHCRAMLKEEYCKDGAGMGHRAQRGKSCHWVTPHTLRWL